MQEWAQSAVDRVLALRPSSVLEVGAGAGILALPLASAVENYVGCDVSPAAIDLLREIPLTAGSGRFELRPADDLRGFGRFDVILLHSVVHHFPDEDYLRRAIGQAADHLTPQGSIVIGDIVDFELRRPYLLERVATQGPRIARPADVLARLAREVGRDMELAVSPGVLADVAVAEGLIPDVRLKTGSLPNEFTIYRVDAVLARPGHGHLDLANTTRHPWSAAPPTTRWAGLVPFVLTEIPHPWQIRTVDALAALEAAPHGPPIDLRALMDDSERGVLPATLRQTARGLGLSCTAIPATTRVGHYDALLTESVPTRLAYRPAPEAVRGVTQPRVGMARRTGVQTGGDQPPSDF